MDIKNKFNFATALAKAAKANILTKTSIHNQVLSQENKDIKLAIDRESDLFIKERIKAEFPDSILSEEFGLDGALSDDQDLWIVDPLDGSYNFFRGIPVACISIALWRGMEPKFGIIIDLFHDDIYTGLVGSGAWLNDQPIAPAPVKEVGQSVISTGFPVGSSFDQASLLEFVTEIKQYKKVRMIGSAAMSLAYLASGKVDLYRENGTRLWDVAGGIAIVKAAGGQVDIDLPTDDPFLLNVKAYGK